MDGFRALWQRTRDRLAQAASSPIAAARNPAVAAYLDEVLDTFPYTAAAKDWFRSAISFEVENLESASGGGFWYPDRYTVFLYTAQYEAAIHELAHAWWEERRPRLKDALIAATVRLSGESDPRYAHMQQLTHGYIHGIPEQNWPGMLVDRNDWEMYAGMASGMMADLRLVPPYVREFYAEMYQLLPDDAPSPASLARHN
ncbi:MAG TPA: hypothetical protein VFN11_06660 [Ktedonobacterales bacterium]|nr:hypothetical protein [Ktedonobacterales bacterium]